MLNIYYLKLSDLQSFDNHLLDCISDERKRKIESYRFASDKIRSLFSELLLRFILLKKVNLKNSELVFLKNPFGKPFLKKASVYFNLSHSNDYIFCAISEKNIGLDIEKIGSVDIRLAERFFHPDEYQFLLNSPLHKQKELFYTYWTLKESYVKFLGTGLTISLNHFSFVLDETNQLAYLNKKNPFSKKLIFQFFRFDNLYRVAVCSEEKKVDSFYEITLLELLTFFEK